MQDFAAGVVFAALAGEVLPDLRGEGHLGAVLLVGFTALVLLLALGAYSRRQEAGAAEAAAVGAVAAGPGRPVALPWGLLVAVGIDLVIDGPLVGSARPWAASRAWSGRSP